MFLRLLCAVLVSAVLMGSGFAQSAVADIELNTDKLAEHIETMAQVRAQRKNNFLKNIYQQLAKPVQEAGAAGNFVISCIQKVRFQGTEGGVREFAEWKKENRILFSSRDFETAADLHLRYLALTIKRALMDSAEPLQQEVWQYLDMLYKSQELLSRLERDPRQIRLRVYDQNQQTVVNEIVGEMENVAVANAANVRTYVNEMIEGDVTGGLVAQALDLRGHIDRIPNWETEPGNFSGILEQNIRSFLREKKDPRIAATWDYEISYRQSVANLPGNEKELEKFQKEDHARLLWKKSQDIKLVGLPNRALLMQIEVAKQFADHPDFETWTKAITADLETRKKAAATAAAAAAADKDAPINGTARTASPETSEAATP